MFLSNEFQQLHKYVSVLHFDHAMFNFLDVSVAIYTIITFTSTQFIKDTGW